jgi:hypothetical protein
MNHRTLRTLDLVEVAVAQAKLDHPDLGLSVGYIGNMERWGDDRAWRVFTNRVGVSGQSLSFPLGSTDHMLAEEVFAERFPRFLAHALAAPKRA